MRNTSYPQSCHFSCTLFLFIPVRFSLQEEKEDSTLQEAAEEQAEQEPTDSTVEDLTVTPDHESQSTVAHLEDEQSSVTENVTEEKGDESFEQTVNDLLVSTID